MWIEFARQAAEQRVDICGRASLAGVGEDHGDDRTPRKRTSRLEQIFVKQPCIVCRHHVHITRCRPGDEGFGRLDSA